VDVLLVREPAFSLKLYELAYSSHRRAEDLNHRLEGLRKAGMPESPFGYAGSPEQRIGQAEARTLTFGRTWQGQHEPVGPFIAQISQDGTVAFRDPRSLTTGKFLFRDDMLCLQSDDFQQGRPNCGFLYRDPTKGGDARYDYVYVNAFSLLHFSIAQ
jgi:hypothetical protein